MCLPLKNQRKIDEFYLTIILYIQFEFPIVFSIGLLVFSIGQFQLKVYLRISIQNFQFEFIFFRFYIHFLNFDL